jgi:hypothetical protein
VEKAFGVKVSKKLIYSLYLNSIVIVWQNTPSNL